jgi:hypothetical protein
MASGGGGSARAGWGGTVLCSVRLGSVSTAKQLLCGGTGKHTAEERARRLMYRLQPAGHQGIVRAAAALVNPPHRPHLLR